MKKDKKTIGITIRFFYERFARSRWFQKRTNTFLDLWQRSS